MDVGSYAKEADQMQTRVQTAGAQPKCVSRTATLIRSVDLRDSGHDGQRWRCKREKRGGPPFPVCVDSLVPRPYGTPRGRM